MRSEGHAIESICRVLSEQGCQIAVRTYRVWKTRLPSARTLSDARVVAAIEQVAYRRDAHGRRKLTPEGLYGRRKMLACLRRQGIAAMLGVVDRGMRQLGLSGLTRTKRVRATIPGKDGHRAGDLLNRAFTAPASNRVWVTDFTYVRSWAGFVYTAFIVDVFSQRIVAWHCAANKHVDLVETPAADGVVGPQPARPSGAPW